MRKEEKTKLTREKIIQAAIQEFGTKTYEVASLNTICMENQISKGLIYHNFKNKDELYLECVNICYCELIKHLQELTSDEVDVQKKLKEILKARQDFFNENPFYRQIFFNSILMPPNHLVKELKSLRSNYNDFLKTRYQEILMNMELRKDVTMEKALTHLIVLQEMYNSYFRDMYYENEDFNDLVETHENKISELLDIMLYGIALHPKLD